MKLRKGHLVRVKCNPKRRGKVVSADVNHPGHVGMHLVRWRSGLVTQIHRSEIELDPDHPLRGRNVALEHAATDWWEDI